MSAFLTFCLRNRLSVLCLTVVLACCSVWCISTLPVDVFPELEVPRVTIQSEAGGLTAEEVEQYVSLPISSALSGATGVTNVSTSSAGGLSFVWVDFDWGTDIYKARQIVSERLAAIRENLPQNVEYELSPIVSVTGEIMLIAVTGEEGTDPMELRRMAQFELRNRLLSIPGVGQVTVLGGRLPEYQVLYDPDKMRQAGVTLDELKTAVESAQSNVSAGYLEEVAGQELPVQQLSRATETEHIRRAPVATHPSGVLRVEDVADVGIAGAPRRGNAGYAGQDAVVLSVQKVPGTNTLKLTEEVDAAVQEFVASRLPKDMHLHADAYRQADFITLSLENGKNTLIITAIVVMLVIILTLLNVRTALITLLSMPLSVLLGMACFPLVGLTVNIMTLGGLAVAIGDVVDNAIIFVEIAWRRLQMNAALPEAQRRDRIAVLLEAKDEIFSSITSSSLIILLVFAPILFLTGMEGQFYRPLGISYMLALAASLLVAVTIVPVLCYVGFKASKTRQDGDSATATLIKRAYAPLLEFCLRHAGVVVGTLGLATVAALVLASTYGTSFLPPFNEDCYNISINTTPGTSLEETERIARQAMIDMAKIPGVKSVTQRTGRAENDAHAEPVSASELLVRVDMSTDRRELRKAFDKVLKHIPGTSTMVGFPIAHRISAVLSGANSQVAVNIYGTDAAQLRQASQKAAEILNTLPEVADARANREVLVETIRVEYNREVLAAFNLSVGDAAGQVSAALNGYKAGEIISGPDKWDIMLRLSPERRMSEDDVRNLPLIAPGGRTLRLADAADVSRAEATNLILRDNLRLKAMIPCNPAADSNLGDLAKACREHLDPAMNAMGCSVDYAGTIKSREAAGKRLTWLCIIACGLIVLLLSHSLGGVRRALITLVNIPLCLVGGIVAIFLASGDTMAGLAEGVYIHPIISLSSVVGFVTVIGFAIRSGLILLNRYRALEAEGQDTLSAIRNGSRERVIPIMMTSLTTILGLLPLIWAKDQPGGELLAPLAVVQFGGLVSATLLNLLVMPAVCKLTAKWM